MALKWNSFFFFKVEDNGTVSGPAGLSSENQYSRQETSPTYSTFSPRRQSGMNYVSHHITSILFNIFLINNTIFFFCTFSGLSTSRRIRSTTICFRFKRKTSKNEASHQFGFFTQLVNKKTPFSFFNDINKKIEIISSNKKKMIY